MFFKRIAAILALVFGTVGIVGCVAGTYGVWWVADRLERANDRVFAGVDRSLKAVQDRMPVVQEKVKQAKVTTAELKDAVRDWGAKKAQDRLVEKLQIEQRAEKLAGHLQTADLTLDASAEAVRDLRRLLEISEGLGVKVQPASMDPVQDRLASLQEALQQTEQAVAVVRKFAADEPSEERRAKMAQRLARVLLTLSDVDQRLVDVTARVSEVRTEVQQANATTSHYILLGAIVCYGVLAWLGAAQTALFSWGWRCFRRPAPQSGALP